MHKKNVSNAAGSATCRLTQKAPKYGYYSVFGVLSPKQIHPQCKFWGFSFVYFKIVRIVTYCWIGKHKKDLQECVQVSLSHF
jgi:hypothetical protein